MIDLVLLNRIQFAISVFFHYLFVPLTIGLGLFIASFELLYLKTKNEFFQNIIQYWSKLFKINFAFGIITGFSMTFQFGTNWGFYSEFMGDIFASPLALEALIAFFLEATFFGIWISTTKKNQYLKAISMCLVSIGTTISSLWIITANSFMQNPVGYQLSNDGTRIIMNNFLSILSNPYLWHMLFHTLLAAYSLTSIFIISICSYNILSNKNKNISVHSIKIGIISFFITSLLLMISGMRYGHFIASVQPIKAASMEAIWESTSYTPMYLFIIPGNNGKNILQIFGIPYIGSYLLTGHINGTVIGLNSVDIAERPFVPIIFFSFRTMVILCIVFLFQSIFGIFCFIKKNTSSNIKKIFLKMMYYSLPLPYIATISGWTVAEVGRQPWIVYGLLKTSEAISLDISIIHVLFTLIGITLFYILLGLFYVYLIQRSIKTFNLEEVKYDN